MPKARNVHIFLFASLFAVFSGQSISFACSDRPGTPSQLAATRVTDRSAILHWQNNASEAVWFDIALTRNGRDVPGYTGVSGDRTRPPRGSELRKPIKGLTAGSRYCFRTRARTASGSGGCVSAQWSAPECFNTLKYTPPLFSESDVRKSKKRRSPSPVLR